MSRILVVPDHPQLLLSASGVSVPWVCPLPWGSVPWVCTPPHTHTPPGSVPRPSGFLSTTQQSGSQELSVLQESVSP